MRTICNCCETSVSIEEAKIIDGNVYCNNCINRLFIQCNDCGDFVRKEYSYRLNNKCYCEYCIDKHGFCCEDCNEFFPYDQGTETEYGYLCEVCIRNNYNTCENCGRIVICDESVYYKDLVYCESCYHNLMKSIGIHYHIYTPKNLKFHNIYGEPNKRVDNLHIGMELEIQGDDRDCFCKDINSIYNAEDIFYMKKDGSLDDERGVEIVSNPMTYEFIMKTNHFRHLFEKLKEHNMNDTIDCGLHFHLDREYLDEFYSHHIASIIDYIVNHFSSYFESFGGRMFNDYCKKADKSTNNWGRPNSSRYYAVNFANTKTIELRFCASTDDYDTFINRVKMVFGIVYFAQKYSFDDVIAMSSLSFIRKFNTLCREKFGEPVKRI